jgi:hypothetical protein
MFTQVMYHSLPPSPDLHEITVILPLPLCRVQMDAHHGEKRFRHILFENSRKKGPWVGSRKFEHQDIYWGYERAYVRPQEVPH